MGILDDPDIRADSPDDTVPHIGIMRAGITDWISPGDARCEYDRFCPSLDEHLRPRYRPLTGAPATRHKPNNLNGSGLLECTFSLPCYEEIRGSRAHILGHHAADDTNLHTGELSTLDDNYFHRA